MNKDNTFETIIPIHLIKGKGEDGKELMLLQGVASTPSLDSDGEYLDPKGFDTKYFLKYGFMNWNHQTNNDPLSIVGKPIEAKVTKSGQFKIKFRLFPDSEKAQHIYQLQQILQSQGLALGLSIEGKVIERDKQNPKIVKKAQITGCAITPNPKNQDTVMSIIKGNDFNTLSAYDDVDENERQKALSAQSSSGVALSKESLDGDIKYKNCKKQNKMINKGDFFDKIFRKLPSITNLQANKLYQLTNKIQKSINMEKQSQKQQELVSDEAIQKALQTLGLESEDQVENESEDQAIKGEDVSDQSDNDLSELEKAKQAIELLKKQNEQLKKGDSSEDDEDRKDDEDDKDDENHDDEGDVKKSKKDMSKGQDTTKPFEDVVDKLLKSQANQLNQKFQAVGQIFKAIENQNLQISERLENLEKQTPGRKSIMTKGYVEKGNFTQDGQQKQQNNTLSVSRNKREICDLVTKSITSDGEITDKQTANDILSFEQAGVVRKGLVEKIKQLGYQLSK